MPTKPDRTRHALTVPQLNAIDRLAAGATDAEAAEAAGVTRQTVNGWRNHHPGFIAALNARRAEVWGAATDRLRALLPKALDALETAVTAEPPDWRAAARIVELAGLARQAPGARDLGPGGIGPTDPSGVVDAEARRSRVNPLADLVGDGPVTEAERGAVLAVWTAALED